jgi:cation diffusion facilitator family transporter
MSTERYRKTRDITLIGALINGVQGILKLIFGGLGHSHALIADGLHSLSDLITDVLVIVAAHYGSQNADHDHPYGHGRIETAATVALSILIIVAGLGIMYGAGEHFVTTKVAEIPHLYTLMIAVFSAIANEIIFRLTLRQAKSLQHALLEANAWHHRSDAASSAIVVLGIGGALLGWLYCDLLAALFVGVLIIKMGWQLAWTNLRELVDTGLDQATLQAIKKAIKETPGVRELHQLRTRSMAGRYFIDVHILVDGHISVSEGHYIATKVHALLMANFSNIMDVTVHVDPENDEQSEPSENLPTRDAITEWLATRWSSLAGNDAILKLTLHYLNGKLTLEVVLPISVLGDVSEAQSLQKAYQVALKERDDIEVVHVLFQ